MYVKQVVSNCVNACNSGLKCVENNMSVSNVEPKKSLPAEAAEMSPRVEYGP